MYCICGIRQMETVENQSKQQTRKEQKERPKTSE